MDWPFNDLENVAAFTSTKVMRDKEPILYVSHDEDDGAWQFHTGEITKMEEAMIVTLKEVYIQDSSIGLLAKLQYGYVAERQSNNHEWVIRKKE